METEGDALVGGDRLALDPARKTIGRARLDDRQRTGGLQIWIVLAVIESRSDCAPERFSALSKSMLTP